MKAPVATKIFMNAGTGARKLTRKKTNKGPRSISSLAPPCGSGFVVIPGEAQQLRAQPREDRRGGGRPPSRRRRSHGSVAQISLPRQRGFLRAPYHLAWS